MRYLFLMTLIACNGPSTTIEPTDSPSAVCESLRASAHSYIQRCTSADYVCVPPALLQPCSQALAVDQAKLAECAEWLAEPRACSYVSSGCDWANVITFGPTPVPTVGMDIYAQCEAYASRVRERGLRGQTYDDVICVHPDRVRACSSAVSINEWWGWCLDKQLTAPLGENPCKDLAIVEYGE